MAEGFDVHVATRTSLPRSADPGRGRRAASRGRGRASSRPDASAGGGLGNRSDVRLDALYCLLRNERPEPPQLLSGRNR